MNKPMRYFVIPFFISMCLFSNGLFAKTAQQLRAEAIPFNDDNQLYDYYKGVVVSERPTRVNSCHRFLCKPTTMKISKGELVSIHSNFSKEAYIASVSKELELYRLRANPSQIKRFENKLFAESSQLTVPLFFISGWADGDDSRSINGYIPHSAIKILSDKEYQLILNEKYPRFERKADATNRVKFFLEPNRGQGGHRSYGIGPDNQFGGDKSLEVTRRTPDHKWYYVQYWTGEVGGYRKGWVPTNSIQLHLTKEEKERERIAAKRRDAEHRKFAKERRKLQAETAEREKQIINHQGVDLFKSDDPFSDVLAHLPMGTNVEILMMGNFWVKIRVDDMVGFVDKDAVK